MAVRMLLCGPRRARLFQSCLVCLLLPSLVVVSIGYPSSLFTMVNNWGDHDSSDDESAGGHHHHREEEAAVVSPDKPAEEQPKRNRPPKTYEFPSQPPYQAYVGNLDWTMTDTAQLSEELTALAKEQLGVDLVIKEARLIMDFKSDTPRNKGFGYVEFETVDMLKDFMKFNDKDYMLAGRRLQVDTSSGKKNDRRKGGRVDGSKFRDGKFSRKEDNAPPGERPKLSLKPRSKPVGSEEGGASSGIFGGAKARDEQNWRERSKNDRDQGGRGRGGGRGDKKGRKERKEKPKEAPKPVVPQPKVEPKPAAPKVVNAFAALGMSDSDSE